MFMAALEIFSENSGWPISPRISFSHDLSQTDRFGGDADDNHHHHLDQDSLLLSSTPSSSDFRFCVPAVDDVHLDYNSTSPADQLFSQGKLLPLAATHISTPPLPPPPPPPPSETTEFLMTDHSRATPPPTFTSKSFWGFSRSRSTSCVSKSALISSLTKLTRSRSMGSNTKDAAKKPVITTTTTPMVGIKSGAGRRSSQLHRKDYGNAVRISPVLNVPPPCMSRERISLFSFGYFLCKKEKKEKTSNTSSRKVY